MDIVIIILVLGAVIYFFTKGNKKKVVPIVEEILLEGEPNSLMVFCETCGNVEVNKGETISIRGSGCFIVKGYNTEGKEVRLIPSQIQWSSGCGCISFGLPGGIKNYITSSLGGVRNISVRCLANARSFGFKIDFGKRSK